MLRRVSLALGIAVAFAAPSVAVAASTPSASLRPAKPALARGERVVELQVATNGLGACTLRANRQVAGLPRRLDPCPASEVVDVELPANRGLEARRYRFTLEADGVAPAHARVLERSQYRVLLYGDSIAWQFAPYLERQLERTGAVQVRVAAFPGTSLCDGLSIAATDAASYRPDVVVAQYVGSPFTACSQSPAYGTFGQPAWYAQLARDAATMARTFHAAGASSVQLDAGPVHQDSSVARDATISAYDRAVRSAGRYAQRIEPYLAVEAAGDRYVAFLPCLASEVAHARCLGPTRHGVQLNRVRSPAPDRFHLCPTTFGERRQPGCDTYASGARRYAAAIATPLIEAWGLSPVPAT